MTKICVHCYISGRVQGVFYRASTKSEASNLGLSGWVKNLPDGRVEALVCGEENIVNQLIKWMHTGPAGAKVSKVDTTLETWQEDFVSFNVLT